MRRIDRIGRAEGAQRIVGVAVWIGALSHMSAVHFGEHFAQAAAGTIADGARLDITISDDAGHEHAQDILLKSVDVET